MLCFATVKKCFKIDIDRWMDEWMEGRREEGREGGREGKERERARAREHSIPCTLTVAEVDALPWSFVAMQV